MTGLLCLATVWLPWPFNNADIVLEATGIDFLRSAEKCLFITFRTPAAVPVRWQGQPARGGLVQIEGSGPIISVNRLPALAQTSVGCMKNQSASPLPLSVTEGIRVRLTMVRVKHPQTPCLPSLTQEGVDLPKSHGANKKLKALQGSYFAYKPLPPVAPNG